MPDSRTNEAALARYSALREPGATPEPAAGAPPPADPDTPSPRFVVQRHSARRLHYDLRLERDGVLASWAVPKGLPLARGRRRLAVRTEDHPLAYLDFAGEIPSGRYGAGVMDVYDAGPYELLDEHPQGRLDIRLGGARLRGVWTLVPGRADAPDEWLLISRDGPPPRDLLRIPPMLAAEAPAPPVGADAIHEPLLDGLRLLARLDDGDVELWTHGCVDAAPLVPGLAADLGRGLRTFSCVVDGVAVVVDAGGRVRPPRAGEDDGMLLLVAFDLLEHEGGSLLDRPLAERRALLEQLVDERTDVVRLSRAYADPELLLEAASDRDLPGIVVKDPTAPYAPGLRSPAWRAVRSRPRDAADGATAADARGVIDAPDDELVPGATRGAVAAYYASIASALLPHLRERPLLAGRAAEAPPWLRRGELAAAGERQPALLVDDLRGLVWVVAQEAADLRVALHRGDDPTRPDTLLLDLSGPAGDGFEAVREVALLARDALAGIGLAGVPVTTGPESLELLVPIARGPSYPEVRGLARTIATALARAAPELAREASTPGSDAPVAIDGSANHAGGTLIAPYAVLALPGAPIACPLAWEELEAPYDPTAATLAGVRERVARLGDVLAPLRSRPQEIGRLLG